jgi:hypothetical protein
MPYALMVVFMHESRHEFYDVYMGRLFKTQAEAESALDDSYGDMIADLANASTKYENKGYWVEDVTAVEVIDGRLTDTYFNPTWINFIEGNIEDGLS